MDLTEVVVHVCEQPLQSLYPFVLQHFDIRLVLAQCLSGLCDRESGGEAQEDDLALGFRKLADCREDLLDCDLRLSELLRATLVILNRLIEFRGRPACGDAAVERDHMVVSDAEEPCPKGDALIRTARPA